VLQAFYDNSPTPGVLIDLADLPTIQIASKEITTLAAFKPRFEGKRSPGRTAVLAAEQLHFGMARMFESQNEIQDSPHTVKVFRDIDSAISWIEGN
jgi:hypothetical protein